MKFPTGGKAREPRGMIRCNSEADSIVWMEEAISPFFMVKKESAPDRSAFRGLFVRI